MTNRRQRQRRRNRYRAGAAAAALGASYNLASGIKDYNDSTDDIRKAFGTTATQRSLAGIGLQVAGTTLAVNNLPKARRKKRRRRKRGLSYEQ